MSAPPPPAKIMAVLVHGCPRIFSMGGQIRGLGTGWSLRGSLRASRPQRPTVDRLWKWCINNSSTERFAVTTDAQNTLQHFQKAGGKWGKCPLLPVLASAHVYHKAEVDIW